MWAGYTSLYSTIAAESLQNMILNLHARSCIPRMVKFQVEIFWYCDILLSSVGHYGTVMGKTNEKEEGKN